MAPTNPKESESLTTFIAELEKSLDTKQQTEIANAVAAFMNSPEYKAKADKPQIQQKMLANFRLSLILPMVSAKALATAWPKTQADQLELASAFRDSVNTVSRDLLKDAATRGLNLEEKNAAEGVTRWYTHRDAVIGKYLETATSVQQAITGFASLFAIAGMVMQVMPGHEQTGQMLYANAFRIQKEMAGQIGDQMAIVNKMQTDNMPSRELLNGINASNRSLRSSVTADEDPIDRLFGETARRYGPEEVRNVFIQYLKNSNMVDGKDFAGDFLRSPLSTAARVRPGAPFTMLPLGQDAVFDRAHAIVANFEGVYANNPKDQGGETIYGIASTRNPEAFAKVKALYDKGKTSEAAELARGFYHVNFWKPVVTSGMTSVEALVTYDTAVNMGPEVAKEIHAKAKGNVREMLRLRQQRYDQIIAGDPSQAEFKNGWTNRLHGLKAYVDRYEKETNPEFAEKSGTDTKVSAADQEAALTARAKDGASIGIAAIAKASQSSKDVLAQKTQDDHRTAAARTPAPKEAKGDVKGLCQTAQAMSMDGEAGSFAEGIKKTVSLDPRVLPVPPAPKTIGG